LAKRPLAWKSPCIEWHLDYAIGTFFEKALPSGIIGSLITSGFRYP